MNIKYLPIDALRRKRLQLEKNYKNKVPRWQCSLSMIVMIDSLFPDLLQLDLFE